MKEVLEGMHAVYGVAKKKQLRKIYMRKPTTLDSIGQCRRSSRNPRGGKEYNGKEERGVELSLRGDGEVVAR